MGPCGLHGTIATAILALARCVACDPCPLPADYPSEPPLTRGVCEAFCARSIRCQGPRHAACACEGASGGPEILRDDWAQAEITCLERTPCDAPDVCDSDANRAVGATPLAWPPVVMQCLQRGSACGGSAENCRHLAAVSDEARAEASACFDLPCDEYAACFRSFVASRLAPAVPTWR